jgi:hypothetical protein
MAVRVPPRNRSSDSRGEPAVGRYQGISDVEALATKSYRL